MKVVNRMLQILAILGAVASGILYYSFEKLSTSNDSELVAAKDQLKLEQSKANNLATRISTQVEELEVSQQELSDAKSELVTLSAKLGQLQRENKRFADERSNFQITQERLQNENARLSQELATVQANSLSEKQVADLRTKIVSLERDLLEARQTRPSANIDSSIIANILPSNPSITGNVLTVGKGASFVILDIGHMDGVRLNNELVIQHAGTAIAKIQITEVKENLSIARVLPDSLIKTPQSGDSVSSLN